MCVERRFVQLRRHKEEEERLNTFGRRVLFDCISDHTVTEVTATPVTSGVRFHFAALLPCSSDRTRPISSVDG